MTLDLTSSTVQSILQLFGMALEQSFLPIRGIARVVSMLVQAYFILRNGMERNGTKIGTKLPKVVTLFE